MLRGELDIDSVRNVEVGESGRDPVRTLVFFFFLLLGMRMLSSIMLGSTLVTTVTEFLMLVVRLMTRKHGRSAVTILVWNTLRLLMMVM